MKEYKNGNRSALLVLHEIYGVNQFMEEQCIKYHQEGFDVFCPCMLGRSGFSYDEQEKAYQFFVERSGFEFYKTIEREINRLKKVYDQVIVLGFSTGAALAWRCSACSKADGIICCYGSRIRDYMDAEPCCPVLLLFAEADSFNVKDVCRQLESKKNVEIHTFHGEHGFIDPYSHTYSALQAKAAEAEISRFMHKVRTGC